MAIDLYTKTEEEPTWKKVMLIISIIILVIVLIIFLVQKFSIIPNNEEEKINLRTQIAVQGSEEQVAQKEEVLAAEQKIKTFQTIYQSSPVFDDFFDNFEEWIYPRVYFTSFALDASTAQLELTGETDTLQSLMQQMIIFDEQENIVNYAVSNIEASEDTTEVSFDVALSVNPSLFQKIEINSMEINNFNEDAQ
jgi:uncharacterized protein YxeA